MEKNGEQIKVTEKEAKGGARPQGMRWVLAISLLLAIVAMSIMWIVPALS